MQDDIIEGILTKISLFLEPSKVSTREVEFVHQVGKSAYFSSSARKSALNVLWDIFIAEKTGYLLALGK